MYAQLMFKDLLCTNQHKVVTSSTNSDVSLCFTLAAFFVKKGPKVTLTNQQFSHQISRSGVIRSLVIDVEYCGGDGK